MRDGHQHFTKHGRTEHGLNTKQALETWKTFSKSQREFWHTRAKNHNKGVKESADDMDDLQGIKLYGHLCKRS